MDPVFLSRLQFGLTAGFHYIFPPLGMGVARIPEVVRALLDIGYDGWWVIEQDTAPDPTATAAANRRYLEGLLGIGSR